MPKTQVSDDRFNALLQEFYNLKQENEALKSETVLDDDRPIRTGSDRFAQNKRGYAILRNANKKQPVTLSDKAAEVLANVDGLIDPADFVMEYIVANRGKGYAGLHSVYSGLNQAIKRLYPAIDPVKLTSQMAADGLIVIRYVKGGAYLIPADEAIQTQTKTKGIDARLAKVLEAFAKA